MMRYAAAGGQHDDCVLSLMLALQGCEHNSPLLLW
jgi:hypothetical protein